MLRLEREKRLWMQVGELRHSGKPDLVVIDEENSRALVIDYKTGRNEVADNPHNSQLRDLAVLVAFNYVVMEVTVAIVQPFSHNQAPCVYEADDLVRSREEMEVRIRASNDPNAKRVAGELQCRHCKAKAHCPEFLASTLSPVTIDGSAFPTPDRLEAGIRALSPARLGAFLGLIRLAADCADQEVRTRLEAGTPVDGWHLSPGRNRETITDPQAVWGRANDRGVTIHQFMKTVNVTKSGLKDCFRVATGMKGKALDGELRACLDGLTETKQGAPVLERE